LLRVEGPHTQTLKAAGLEVVYPMKPQFTRGNCGEAESLDELSVADAVIVGSEYIRITLGSR
jgi:hypothetical protein